MAEKPMLTRIDSELWERAAIKALKDKTSLAVVVRKLLAAWVDGRVIIKTNKEG